MRLSETFLYEGEKLIADGEFECLGLLNNNKNDKILSFLDNERFLDDTNNEFISCIICREEFVPLLPMHIEGVIVSEQPSISYWKRHNAMQEKRKEFTTRIGSGCEISPLAYIAKKNVVIGNNVKIEEFVCVKENVVIGDNCIIRAGCVIGSQGFEFKNTKDGMPFAVEHFGGVIIEQDVELQGMTHVAKAIDYSDDTVIGRGSKIDGLVHIAHADKIGRNCRIAAGAVLSGSVCIGSNVWIGPNATISNGIFIGDGARVSIGSVVTKKVEQGTIVSGNFAINHKTFMEHIKAIANK